METFVAVAKNFLHDVGHPVPCTDGRRPVCR